jgi:hypothetical protein
MIAEALCVEIGQHAGRMRSANPLLLRAQAGTLTLPIFARYLMSLRAILGETPTSLALARDRARDRGDEKLAAYWEKKAREPIGKDRWATDDLAHDVLRGAGPGSVVPAAAKMITFHRATIDEDPALFLSCVLFTAYIPVLLGPAWLDALEQRCGIPRAAMSVIDRHIEADEPHVEDTLEDIDDLVDDPRKLPRMREVLRAAMEGFERVCCEISRAEGHDGIDAAGRARTHVSAA